MIEPQEIEELLNETAEAQQAQLVAVKQAHEALQVVQKERDYFYNKTAAAEARVRTLEAQLASKSASIPEDVCNSIADSLAERGLLTSDERAPYSANLVRDPSLIKFAFAKIAERIPLVVRSQGSPIRDKNIQFPAEKATGSVSWS